jgi:hypothetical protein
MCRARVHSVRLSSQTTTGRVNQRSFVIDLPIGGVACTTSKDAPLSADRRCASAPTPRPTGHTTQNEALAVDSIVSRGTLGQYPGYTFAVHARLLLAATSVVVLVHGMAARGILVAV